MTILGLLGRLLRLLLGFLLGYVALLGFVAAAALLIDWAVTAVFGPQGPLAAAGFASYTAPGVCLAGIGATYLGSSLQRRNRYAGSGFLAGAAAALVCIMLWPWEVPAMPHTAGAEAWTKHMVELRRAEMRGMAITWSVAAFITVPLSVWFWRALPEVRKRTPSSGME